ncbi:hypothetical protein HAX54_019787, partial [Datura stramonium]|nr:hypothetical protein [Datura stramonium]
HDITRIEFQIIVTSIDVYSHLGKPRARGLPGGQYLSHNTNPANILGAECGGDAMRDAQEDVPSA